MWRARCGPAVLRRVLELDGEDAQGGFADVFEGVRGERSGPGGGAFGWVLRIVAGVEKDGSGVVAADELAPGEDVVDGRPAVGVERDGVARRNGGVEDADGIVFEEDGVIRGCGDHGVEVVGPVGGCDG